MGRRKKKPEPPYHFWLDTDNCWFCKNRNACGNCKILKQYVAKERSQRKIRRDERRFLDNS